MYNKTFAGGVHPEDGKALARDLPFRACPPGEELIFPLNQHIGKPAVPVKSAGDTVRRGELLAQAAEGLSVNIHASIDGVVEQVTGTGATIRRKE